MARKQARRKSKKQVRRLSWPAMRPGRIITPLVAASIVVGVYHLSSRLLDRPIRSIEISGPFQRVSALSIEEAIADELDAGFLGADLSDMQGRIEALAWIDKATVARRWPNRIAIAVTEQTPAAIWGERGLLNVRGELFVSDARHVPAELPRLSGPDNRAADVAGRYLAVRERLIPVGLDVRRVDVDARGAWQMTLTNGVGIRLGRRDVERRTALFVDIVANIITGHAAEIDYVDMRYSNGFSIGWKDGVDVTPGGPGDDPAMLASAGSD